MENIDKISYCAVPTTWDFSKSMTMGQKFQHFWFLVLGLLYFLRIKNKLKFCAYKLHWNLVVKKCKLCTALCYTYLGVEHGVESTCKVYHSCTWCVIWRAKMFHYTFNARPFHSGWILESNGSINRRIINAFNIPVFFKLKIWVSL